MVATYDSLGVCFLDLACDDCGLLACHKGDSASAEYVFLEDAR